MRRHPLILAALLAGCTAHRPPMGPPPGDGPPPRSPGRFAGPGGPPRGAPIPARLFISPMGEPFRSDRGGDPEAAWFDGADADHDGRLSLAEFQADAQRWFRRADRGNDGEIDPDDIENYENELVPEIRVADEAPGGRDRGGSGGGRGGPDGGGGPPGGGGSPSGGGMGGGGSPGRGGGPPGGQQGGGGDKRPAVATATRRGAAHYAYLDFPEPLTSADRNLNRGIGQAEMARAAAERFATLDRNDDGFLDRRELPRVDTRTSGKVPPRGGGPRRPDGGRPGEGNAHREDEDE